MIISFFFLLKRSTSANFRDILGSESYLITSCLSTSIMGSATNLLSLFSMQSGLVDIFDRISPKLAAPRKSLISGC